MNPRISVVIPVFNTEKSLKQCLDSLINQVNDDFEVICVNDASTDNSLKILEEYSAKDSRVRVISNEVNLGVGASRNRGIELGVGEYIWFLDSDDWVREDSLDRIINAIEKSDADIIISRLEAYDSEFDCYGLYCDKITPSYTRNKNLSPQENDNIYVLAAYPDNKIFRRSLLTENNIKFTDLTYHEDFLFYFLSLGYAESVYIIDDIFAYYRTKREGSLSNAKLSHLIYNSIKVYYQIGEYPPKNCIKAVYHMMIVELTFFLVRLRVEKIIWNRKDYNIWKKFIADAYRENDYLRGNHLGCEICDVILKSSWSWFCFKNLCRKYFPFYFSCLVKMKKYKVKKIVQEKCSDIAVSIIVSGYSARKKFRACLESLYEQSFKNIEIICVDNNFAKDFLSIVEEFQSFDKRIVLVNNEKPTGISEAMNIGINSAKGKYIMFLNGDERLATDACENFYYYANTYDLDIVVANSCQMDKNFIAPVYNKALNSVFDKFLTVLDPNTCDVLHQLSTNLVPKLFKRDLILDNNIIFESDEECFYLSVLKQSKKVMPIGEIITYK